MNQRRHSEAVRGWTGFPLDWQVTSWSAGDRLIGSVARRSVRSPVSRPGTPAGGSMICRLLPRWAEPLRRDVSSVASHRRGSRVVFFLFPYFVDFIFQIFISTVALRCMLNEHCLPVSKFIGILYCIYRRV